MRLKVSTKVVADQTPVVGVMCNPTMDTVQIAKEAFERIRASDSNLQMAIEADSPNVDLAMIIRKQPGLNFDVRLNLQNGDELQLNVGPFCGEWFPCTDTVKVREFEAAVNGVLCGAYRLEITTRGNSPIKALLQKPEGGSWATVYTWQKLHFPIGKKATSYVQNQSNT